MRTVQPADDYMHANTGEANFNESMYFNFYDRRTRLGAFLRIGNRPNERYAETTLAVYQPDGTALVSYQRPEIADNGAFAAGGMRFDVVEPARHLRVTYDGTAVHLARPLDLEDPRRAFTSNPHLPVALTLDYHGLSPLFGGEAPEQAAMVFAKGHYEQQMRATGRLTVAGTAYAVDGLGLRDHSWGPRSWQSPRSYRWLIGQFDEGFGFMGSLIVTPAGTELRGGFVFRDGANRAVDTLAVDTEWAASGYHERIRLTLHGDGGDVVIDGRVLAMLPLRNRRDGKVTRIAEGLTEWRCGDHVGYGWSEYLDQVA